jgi:hypothetical protein
MASPSCPISFPLDCRKVSISRSMNVGSDWLSLRSDSSCLGSNELDFDIDSTQSSLLRFAIGDRLTVLRRRV